MCFDTADVYVAMEKDTEASAFDIPFFPGCAVSSMSLACVLSVHQYVDDSKNVSLTSTGKKVVGNLKQLLEEWSGGRSN